MILPDPTPHTQKKTSKLQIHRNFYDILTFYLSPSRPCFSFIIHHQNPHSILVVVNHHQLSLIDVKQHLLMINDDQKLADDSPHTMLMINNYC